jgi:hypothetical protein
VDGVRSWQSFVWCLDSWLGLGAVQEAEPLLFLGGTAASDLEPIASPEVNSKVLPSWRCLWTERW